MLLFRTGSRDVFLFYYRDYVEARQRKPSPVRRPLNVKLPWGNSLHLLQHCQAGARNMKRIK